MKILGIESSADETAAAVVEDGTKLLSSAVASSLDLHVVYGGIVPEIAARSHLEVIIPVIDQALRKAFKPEARSRKSKVKSSSWLEARGSGLKFDPWDQIDAIAVTQGPGLLGSLLIGILTAKTLAAVKNKPLIPVNHTHAHIYAAFLNSRKPEAGSQKPSLPPTPYALSPKFPLLALTASGGHTQLVMLKSHEDYSIIGRTRDDAAGEAYDKVAKMLGLPYPGGPQLEKIAKKGDSHAFDFPEAKARSAQSPRLDEAQGAGEQRTEAYQEYAEGAAQPATQRFAKSGSKISGSAGNHAVTARGLGPYDFSFSGLKTAVLRAAQTASGHDFTFPSIKLPEALNAAQKADIAASFQQTINRTLAGKLAAAAREFHPKSIIVSGGTAANQDLRRTISEHLPKTEVIYPPLELCTDNAAMIASAAFYLSNIESPYSISALPDLTS